MRLIDKEAAKAELLRVMGDVQAYGAYFDGIRDAYQNAADLIDKAPTVEDRQHGYWKEVGSWHECSCCKQRIDSWDRKWMKYCSVCGAIMDGGDK